MPEAGRDASNTLQNDHPHVVSQKKLCILCHSGLDKPAPYLIWGGNDDPHHLQPTCPFIFLKDEANSTSAEDIPSLSSLF